MKRTVILVSLVLLFLAGLIYFGLLLPAGVFKTIRPHFNGSITTLDFSVAGPEDITIDQEHGLAFISADDRRAHASGNASDRGEIYLLDLSNSVYQPRAKAPPSLTDFHPHGISLWISPEGKRFLFVINHRQQNPAHVVERFEFRNDSLVHLESIADDKLMTSPNDLVAVGERSFYVTNDHYFDKPGLSRTLEDYLQRAIAYVNYYDGKSFRKVAEGIAYANGITVSPDQTKIIVAATTGRNVQIYQRDAGDGSLILDYILPVNTGVDNIEVDTQGNLWIGCHPQLLKFVAHAKDPVNFSPSQVLKLIPEGTTYRVEEILLNDGTAYSGSSVAAVYQNTLLIGSVFEKSILICTLNHTP
ncbi:MAG: SMP-30/gluconolactonase/LRE family protein [Cyclobacteriaceae bacterium]|jgi:arylesterase/paraoxonase|nr:SMP-30/gluconolactonase/LRE family protein [Cyclobacteriaceae bacterium]